MDQQLMEQDNLEQEGDTSQEAEELELLRDQVAHFQTVIAVLVKRSGGRIFMPDGELKAIVGHGIRLSYEDDGIKLVTIPPAGREDNLDALITHHQPTTLQ